MVFLNNSICADLVRSNRNEATKLMNQFKSDVYCDQSNVYVFFYVSQFFFLVVGQFKVDAGHIGRCHRVMQHLVCTFVVN